MPIYLGTAGCMECVFIEGNSPTLLPFSDYKDISSHFFTSSFTVSGGHKENSLGSFPNPKLKLKKAPSLRG